MAQRIIIVHGRSTKPAKARLARLIRKALLHGLERTAPAKAARVADGSVEIDYAYFGDINNAILAETSERHRKSLTDRDPHCDDAPCLPDTGLDEAIEALADIKRFDKRAYRRILRDNDDLRFIDSAARALSTIAAITSASLLNEYAIRAATTDMGAYLMRRAIGSAVRERLQTPLRRSLKRGDDICLVSHSMGCIVAYDVLWKFSRMSEYRDVRENGNRVTRWITLGCPLGEAGVKANLYDSDERAHSGGTDKHPRDIVQHWHNVAAVDDFISHDPTMRNDFSDMLKFDMLQSIEDRTLYNCYAMGGKANPHKIYGYLANPRAAGLIADWIEA